MTKHRRPWGRRIWNLAKFLIAAGLVAAAVYWMKFSPVAVTRNETTRGQLVAEVMGSGTLEPHVKATISPKISGLITHVLVDQGDRVEAGQLLARLDDRELVHQVEVAEAGVATATAALDRLRADRARAVAVLEQARREHARLENLRAQGTASPVELDRAIEALRISEAESARAEAAIIEGNKQLHSAEKTLDYYRARLADTEIKAPFAGLIVRRDRDPGDVVLPGSSILAVISLDVLWISAWVDETEMARLKPGQNARVVFRSEPDRSYEGEVARLGREADRETREFRVDVTVRQLPDNWAVGQRAEVYIETARNENALVLPAGLLVRRDGKPGVFVAADHRAAWRPLELGLRAREAVEILDGLQPGDAIVTPVDPSLSLMPGRRIRIR